MSTLPVINARPRLSLNGEARADLDEAVLEAVIQLPLAGQSSAEVRLLNWGPPDSGNREPGFRFDAIRFGDNLEIRLSEEGDDAIFSGQITAIEERYGDGAPHLVLLAEDALHRLARQRHSRSFQETSLSELIQQLVADSGLETDINIGEVSGQWLQLNESNLAMLLRLLPPIAIWPRLEGGTLRAKPEQSDAEPIIVSAQDNALRVRLIADLNQQPSEAQVLGFNPSANEAVEANHAEPGGNSNGTTAAQALQNLGWEGAQNFPQPFAHNQGYADLLAKGRMQFQAGRFIHGEILCKGIPNLRSGRELELIEVSARLAGRYRAVHCTHRFDTHNGYQTRVKVNRADWEGL